MQNIIDNALEYVEEVFKTDYSGHDYFHTFRVYKMATNIAIKENADLEIVQLAALLHDVDDVKLSPKTYTNKDRTNSFYKKLGYIELKQEDGFSFYQKNLK